jgi:hypothetical protein
MIERRPKFLSFEEMLKHTQTRERDIPDNLLRSKIRLPQMIQNGSFPSCPKLGEPLRLGI